MFRPQINLTALKKIVQAIAFSTAAFVLQQAQALVTEPAMFYSASIPADTVLQAEDPQELVDTYNRYMKIRFDKCMSQAPPVSCVLLEVNRDFKSPVSINGLPAFITWYMRQTNVTVNPDSSSSTAVNENGLNYLEAKLVVECPYGVTPYLVSSQSGADGTIMNSSVCPFQEETPDECAVAGNPVNFLSGDKVELVHDFFGRGGLTLTRRYINQKVGWQVEPLDVLVDLSQGEAGAEPNRACSGYSYSRSMQRLDFSSPDNIQPSRFEKSFCLDFIGPDQTAGASDAPDVIIKADDGRIREFFLENGAYRSAAPGVVLRSVSASSLAEPSWKFIDEDGASKFFNSDGYLLRAESADQRESLFYTYLDGKIRTKSNRQGDVLNFHHDLNQQVERVSLPGGAEVHYKFQPANSQASFFRLETVTYEDGQSIDYRYDDPRFPSAITSRIDASGQVSSSWSYDDQGRAVSSERGSGKEMFIFDFSDIVDRQVSVTNPLGKRTTYSFEIINGLQRIIHVEGDASPNCATRSRYRTYYANGALETATDWAGNVTYFERDEMGRITRETQGLRWNGDPQHGVVTSGLNLIETPATHVKETCWQTALNQPKRIIEPDRIRIFDYDPQGRLKSLRIEPRTNANASCS